MRLAPDNASAYGMRALFFADKEDFGRAIADFTQAIHLEPKNWRFHAGRAEAYRIEGEFDLALLDYKNAFDTAPDAINMAELYNARGLVWRDKADYEKALSDFDEAILRNPSYGHPYINRGDIWYLKKDFTKALADFNKALSIIPNAVGLAYRGRAWLALDDRERAFADFKEALRVSPNDIAALEGRGEAYEQSGDLAKARADYERALSISRGKNPPSDWPAQGRARERLAGLTQLEAKAAEEKARRVQEANAAEEKARRIQQAKAAEEEARRVQQAKAAEEKARLVQQAKAAEEEARRVQEAKAAEEKARRVQEAKAAEEKARRIQQAKAAEEEARRVQQAKAAEEEARRIQQAKAAEEEARRVQQAKAAEEEARRIQQAKAAEEEARRVQEAKAAEEKARRIQQAKAAEEKARRIQEAKAAEEEARRVQEAKAAEEKARRVQEAKAAEEKARRIQEAKAAEEEARRVQEAKAAEEEARRVQEAKAAEEEARRVQEAKAAEEKARRVQEAKAAEEKARQPDFRRVALVIGNSDYAIAPLDNPKNDADDVSAALQRLHFDVAERKDITVRDFDQAMDTFEAKAKEADVALFFFSGHGIQIDRRGYLAPVDVNLESESSALRGLEAIQDVVSRIENAAKVSIIVLDACRNSPMQDHLRRIAMAKNRALFSSQQGLPPVPIVGSNTLIVYATVPGETAIDGEGRNSPFTAALLRHIETPGLEIELMFKHVTADVLKATGGKQQPERMSRLQNELVLLPAMTGAMVQAPTSADMQAWIAVQSTTSQAVLEEYVRRFSESTYADFAKARLNELKKAQLASELLRRGRDQKVKGLRQRN